MIVEEWLGKDNTIGIDIWNKKYRYNNESFDEWLNRVSGSKEDLKQLIINKKFLFAGRTLSNRGLNNGSYSNCYSSGFVLDDLKDIMQVNTNIAMTYKSQGGQGLSLSKIRPKGTLINNRYESDGIIPFLEMYNNTTSTISQGGSRKGALMVSLDITHKEAEKFITIKSNSNKINKANLSLEINDEFMKCVEDSYSNNKDLIMTIHKIYGGKEIIYDIIPIKLYKLMIKQAWLHAEPGVIFTERFRNYNLMEFVDKYQIETCNPCITGDSLIQTTEGLIPIKELVGKTPFVYCMDNEVGGSLTIKQASKVWLTKKNANLVKVITGKGNLTCTPDHKIFTTNRGWVEAQNLQKGDKIKGLNRQTLNLGKTVGVNWFVQDVIMLDRTEDVYDMCVPEVHNFIANDMIIHNCGEQPLPKNMACNLGAINLSEYVINPFTNKAYFDYDTFHRDIAICIEALDIIIDENQDNHALEEQKRLSLAYRNIGLGVMGYGDMLIKLGFCYGTKNITDIIFKDLFRYSVLASNKLAAKYGVFPEYTPEIFDSNIIRNNFTIDEIEHLKIYGIRNCSLLSIAPTGSIGTMLNCSTGIEPNFALEFNRKTESLNGDKESYYKIEVDLVKQFKQINKTNILPDYFITSHNINWKDRIYIQGLIQNFIDTAISSTVNLPNNITQEEIELLYLEAWKQGVKGITIYCDGSREGILTTTEQIEKVITTNISPKRPKELKAQLYKVKAQGKQYIVIVGLLDNKPYEIFTFEALHSLYQEEEGIIIKIKKNQYKFKGKYQELNDIGVLCTGKLEKSCTLYTSMLLRHNVDLDFIIKTSKKIDDNITSFVSAMNRILNKYNNKESKKNICPECGNILINTGGCTQCTCGYSKCS